SRSPCPVDRARTAAARSRAMQRRRAAASNRGRRSRGVRRPLPALRAPRLRARAAPPRRPRPGRGRNSGDVRLGLALGCELSARTRSGSTLALCRREKRDRRPHAGALRAADRGTRRALLRARPAGGSGAFLAGLARPPGAAGAARSRAPPARARVLERALAIRD